MTLNQISLSKSRLIIWDILNCMLFQVVRSKNNDTVSIQKILTRLRGNRTTKKANWDYSTLCKFFFSSHLNKWENKKEGIKIIALWKRVENCPRKGYSNNFLLLALNKISMDSKICWIVTHFFKLQPSWGIPYINFSKKWKELQWKSLY